jgi:hypothetical protein
MRKRTGRTKFVFPPCYPVMRYSRNARSPSHVYRGTVEAGDLAFTRQNRGLTGGLTDTRPKI